MRDNGAMLALLALACSTGPVNEWLPPAAASHEVNITPKLDGNPGAPAILLYADRGDDPAAEVCLRVWGDGRWTIAEDTRPGSYDQVTASGEMAADGRLKGTLDPFFQGARAIWKHGADVWIDGIPVPESAGIAN